MLRRHANRPATRSSGASEASGASHWTMKNGSMPSSRPASSRELANGWAKSRITTPDPRNRPITEARRVVTENVPMYRAGPTRWGSSAGARRDAPRVRAEQGHEDHRVDQGDRALQRQGQRVERRHPQESELDRVVSGERDPFPTAAGRDPSCLAQPIPRDEHHHRPADADQEAVGAGHVRQREVARGLRSRRTPGGGGQLGSSW